MPKCQFAKVKVKLLVLSRVQLFETPKDCSQPGVYYITYYIMKVKVKSLSRVRLFVTPWTVTYQGPWSRGFSRQKYWSGLPFPSPGDLPKPGIEPGSPALQTDALLSEPLGKPVIYISYSIIY